MIEEYINEVLKYIDASNKQLRHISTTLNKRMQEELDKDPYFNPKIVYGTPREYAETVKEEFDTSGSTSNENVYEYTSKQRLFGLPLIHIHIGRGRRNNVAKGIIAIGDVALGVIAIGGFSSGLISFGGLSIGALAIGGIVLGGVAIGGISIGALAIGGIAIGIKAIGGLIATL